MTEKISFKNVWMILLALVLSVSATSCLGDDTEEEQLLPEAAASTGLCGHTWALKSIINSDETTITDVPHDTYIFEITGEGYHEYTDATGVVRSVNFTWESYLLNVNLHQLVVRLEGDTFDQYTYYGFDANGTLRLMTANNNGTTVINEYEPQ